MNLDPVRAGAVQLSGGELSSPVPVRPNWWRPRQLSRNAKKLLRTLQVHFPSLLDTKFRVMRWYRNALKVPFEYDFSALPLFHADGATFLDVGANRGQSTDAILMNLANVRIHLFEPNEMLFGKLKRMFGTDDRIVLNDFGLG